LFDAGGVVSQRKVKIDNFYEGAMCYAKATKSVHVN
jgi:hypothetical protein